MAYPRHGGRLKYMVENGKMKLKRVTRKRAIKITNIWIDLSYSLPWTQVPLKAGDKTKDSSVSKSIQMSPEGTATVYS